MVSSADAPKMAFLIARAANTGAGVSGPSNWVVSSASHHDASVSGYLEATILVGSREQLTSWGRNSGACRALKALLERPTEHVGQQRK